MRLAFDGGGDEEQDVRMTRDAYRWAAAIGVVIAVGVPAGAWASARDSDAPTRSSIDVPQDWAPPVAGQLGPVPEDAVRSDGTIDGSKVPEYVGIQDHDGKVWYARAVDIMPGATAR